MQWLPKVCSVYSAWSYKLYPTLRVEVIAYFRFGAVLVCEQMYSQNADMQCKDTLLCHIHSQSWTNFRTPKKEELKK